MTKYSKEMTEEKIKIIETKFPWLKNAIFAEDVINIRCDEYENLIWNSGEWRYGTWKNGFCKEGLIKTKKNPSEFKEQNND